MVRYDRGELLLGSPMAGYMLPEWNRPQPREVRLRRNNSGLYRLHDHHVRRATMQPLPDAIRYFTEPRNITDVRSWFGLVNQVAYAFTMAERMLPFRKLLRNGERFTCSPESEDIFRESKDVLVKEIQRGVPIFEKTKATCIATD